MANAKAEPRIKPQESVKAILSITAEDSGASPVPIRTYGSPAAPGAGGSANSQRDYYP